MTHYLHGVQWCNPGHFPFSYGYCASKKDWKRLMRHLNAKEPYPSDKDSDARMTTLQSKHGITMIVSFSEHAHDFDPITITGLIVHECIHIWQELQQFIGETDPGWEMEAYTVQAIYCEMLNAMLRRHPDLLEEKKDDEVDTRAKARSNGGKILSGDGVAA